MKSVGIRELKATLSKQLEEVKRGEVILVTDRGRVIAELHRPGLAAEPEARDDLDRRLQPWVRAGRLTPGGANEARLYAPSPLAFPEGTAARLVDELRGER